MSKGHVLGKFARFYGKKVVKTCDFLKKIVFRTNVEIIEKFWDFTTCNFTSNW